jgi:hypothetical protein
MIILKIGFMIVGSFSIIAGGFAWWFALTQVH